MTKAAKAQIYTLNNGLSSYVPMLSDIISHAYHHYFVEKTKGYSALTMLHMRVWTRLIENDKQLALYARRQLLEIAASENLAIENVEAIDNLVFDGLHNAISRKARRIGEERDTRVQALYEIAINIGEFRVLLKENKRDLGSSNAFQRIVGQYLG